ncbi:MAG: tRNA threonylcarbamoyladenosine dehydratase [Spirochaetaceae bacterium]|jgi:tRNA A37 threonylcarbamoyladenosine dehydratase|nr:tRNA threonylcarbamoyladenosine dehydratase [Spirochaetaceae bacterium]
MTVNPRFQRLALLSGLDAIEALRRARVIVVGTGGVGSWCAEALARSALGNIDLVDSDTVCVTNINRQVQASSETVGRYKTEALQKRLLEINPQCVVRSFARVFSRESSGEFGLSEADYVIDAIDSLTHKLDLIELVSDAGPVLFSSMGMAQKLDPTKLKTADIWETRGCPLARLVRQGLRKRGFTGHFTAVYSDERLPLRKEISAACGSGQCLCPARQSCAAGPVEWCSSKKVINGSAVTVTATAGFILASLVLRSVCARFGSGEAP